MRARLDLTKGKCVFCDKPLRDRIYVVVESISGKVYCDTYCWTRGAE